MSLSPSQLSDLITQPNESLILEMKDWIDPGTNEGKAKIVKTALAMRNNNGGYLLIGFNNQDGSPNIDEAPDNVQDSFHQDTIQALITKFSSEPFEIFVHYPEVSGKTFVVIEALSGVKTPVATKSELDGENKKLIQAHKVFIRSLNSNNTVSTTEATYKDWQTIIEKCFENREADIGRFIRRHLSSPSLDEANKVLSALITSQTLREEPDTDSLEKFIDTSASRYETALSDHDITAPPHGSMEVAIKINGSINEHTANDELLNLISASNPRYTGRPAWMDSRHFSERNHHPFIFNETWEALISSYNQAYSDMHDYWRISPDGKFYFYRAFQDDIGGGDNAPQPGTALDFTLSILRISECMLVAISFAKAMGCEDTGSIDALYRWKGLRGRTLSSWTNPGRYLSIHRVSRQDEVITSINIPVDIAPEAISDYVQKVTSKLFIVFSGFEAPEEVVNDLVVRLIKRNL